MNKTKKRLLYGYIYDIDFIILIDNRYIEIYNVNEKKYCSYTLEQSIYKRMIDIDKIMQEYENERKIIITGEPLIYIKQRKIGARNYNFYEREKENEYFKEKIQSFLPGYECTKFYKKDFFDKYSNKTIFIDYFKMLSSFTTINSYIVAPFEDNSRNREFKIFNSKVYGKLSANRLLDLVDNNLIHGYTTRKIQFIDLPSLMVEQTEYFLKDFIRENKENISIIIEKLSKEKDKIKLNNIIFLQKMKSQAVKIGIFFLLLVTIELMMVAFGEKDKTLSWNVTEYINVVSKIQGYKKYKDVAIDKDTNINLLVANHNIYKIVNLFNNIDNLSLNDEFLEIKTKENINIKDFLYHKKINYLTGEISYKFYKNQIVALNL